MQNFFFHREFEGIGKFESISSEELDAVVAPGIVRRGDDYARTKAVGVRQKCYCRSRYDPRTLYSNSGLAKARREGACNPRARLARVASQNYAGRGRGLAERVSQCQPRCVDGGCIQRRLACDTANAIGSKEFACSCCSH